MMELTVTLEFACCHCEESVSATLHCTGKGLQPRNGSTPVAAVAVVCPHCERDVQVVFEPVSAAVHAVGRVGEQVCAWPMPSVN